MTQSVKHIQQEMAEAGRKNYVLEEQIEKTTRLFYGKDTAKRRDVVVDRAPITDIEAKRPREEFDSREERNVAKLYHLGKDCKFLVEVLDFFYTGSDPDRVLWTVMERVCDEHGKKPEYMTGIKTLYEKRDIQLEEVVDLFTKICTGIECIHGADFIHRDLKPANILCVQEKGVWIPKISDYHSICGTGSDTKAIHRTLDYKLPDGIKLEGTAKRITDIFATGVMLWETIDNKSLVAACAGTKQFDDMEKLTKILSVLEKQKTIGTPYLKAIVEKALQFEPGKAYQSASEMKLDLELAKRSNDLDKVLALYSEFNAAEKGKIAKGEKFDLSKLQQASDAKDALKLSELEKKSHLWAVFEQQMILDGALADVWNGVRSYAEQLGFKKQPGITDVVQHYTQVKQKLFSSYNDPKQRDKVTAFAGQVVQLCDACGDSPNY